MTTTDLERLANELTSRIGKSTISQDKFLVAAEIRTYSTLLKISPNDWSYQIGELIAYRTMLLIECASGSSDQWTMMGMPIDTLLNSKPGAETTLIYLKKHQSLIKEMGSSDAEARFVQLLAYNKDMLAASVREFMAGPLRILYQHITRSKKTIPDFIYLENIRACTCLEEIGD